MPPVPIPTHIPIISSLFGFPFQTGRDLRPHRGSSSTAGDQPFVPQAGFRINTLPSLLAATVSIYTHTHIHTNTPGANTHTHTHTLNITAKTTETSTPKTEQGYNSNATDKELPGGQGQLHRRVLG